MNRRSQLVSQWQYRLTSAERLAEGTMRFRWIHLARIRLYRFLLSCYGSGKWRSGIEDDAMHAHPRVSDSATDLPPLDGKPPKSAGKIQAVLKAVHNAQDHPPPVGPLVGGLDPQTYMAVTSTDARIDVERCERFLIERGIDARVVGRGRRLTVEVPYAELPQAEALVDAHRQMLRPRRYSSTIGQLLKHPSLLEETQIVVVGMVVVAPVIGLAALALSALVLGNRLRDLEPPALVGLVVGAFLIAVQASILWYVLASRWRTQLSLATRRRIAMATFWMCVGAPAAFVVVAAICVMPDAPFVQSLRSPLAILAIVITIIGLISMSFDWVVRR